MRRHGNYQGKLCVRRSKIIRRLCVFRRQTGMTGIETKTQQNKKKNDNIRLQADWEDEEKNHITLLIK